MTSQIVLDTWGVEVDMVGAGLKFKEGAESGIISLGHPLINGHE